MIILNNLKIATTFNDLFPEIIPSLNRFKCPENVTSLVNNLGIIDNIVLNPKKSGFNLPPIPVVNLLPLPVVFSNLHFLESG